MYNPFQDYFSYTKSKTIGIIGLLLLSLFFFTVPYLYSGFTSVNEPIIIEQKTSSITNTFDPNLADETTLLKYGLSATAVDQILRFRKRGGRFHSIESLQKVYGISAKDYQRIAPFVRITLPQK